MYKAYDIGSNKKESVLVSEYNIILEAQGIWQTIQPFVTMLIPSKVSISLAAGLYLRKKPEELKRIQTETMGSVLCEMLNNGDISHLEFIKFRNISQIAQKADEVYTKRQCQC